MPTRSLIRHLEKSDERVNKAALSLMNVFHSNSDDGTRSEIVDVPYFLFFLLFLLKLLDSVPFRSAVRGSVLRDGRIRDTALLDQLVLLQRLLLKRQADVVKEIPTEEQLTTLTVSMGNNFKGS